MVPVSASNNLSQITFAHLQYVILAMFELKNPGAQRQNHLFVSSVLTRMVLSTSLGVKRTFLIQVTTR